MKIFGFQVAVRILKRKKFKLKSLYLIILIFFTNSTSNFHSPTKLKISNLPIIFDLVRTLHPRQSQVIIHTISVLTYPRRKVQSIFNSPSPTLSHLSRSIGWRELKQRIIRQHGRRIEAATN